MARDAASPGSATAVIGRSFPVIGRRRRRAWRVREPIATRGGATEFRGAASSYSTDRSLRTSWRWDSNPRPPDYKSGALPTELRQRRVTLGCGLSPVGQDEQDERDEPEVLHPLHPVQTGAESRSYRSRPSTGAQRAPQRSCFQRVPVGVSSISMPRSTSIFRMASASEKFRASR